MGYCNFREAVPGGSIPGAGGPGGMRMAMDRTRTLSAATTGLLEVFAGCSGGEYQFDRGLNPRRVLTKPSRPAFNNGHDNEKHDYILYVNDVIGTEEGRK